MAKIVLDNPWLATITGPAGNLRWRSKANAEAEVKAEGGHKSKTSETVVDPKQPLLVSPPTWKCECKAWKVADAWYTANMERIRPYYRIGVRRAGRSAYDGYMKQAIPHLLRGYPAPDLPIQTLGWSLRRLRTPHLYLAGEPDPDATCLPPYQCQTNGLHFMRCQFFFYHVFRFGYWFKFWGLRLAWDSYTGDHEEPRIGNLQVSYYKDHTDDSLLVTRNWGWIRSPGLEYEAHEVGGHWIGVLWTPPKREPSGSLVWPLVKDETQSTMVKWLCPRYRFYHWPRFWPSKKKDFSPIPSPYPSWPPATPYDYFEEIFD